MKQDQAALRHYRGAESLADFLLPHYGRTGGRPLRRQIRGRVDAVARRAEELRPVLGERAGGYQNEYGDSRRHLGRQIFSPIGPGP